MLIDCLKNAEIYYNIDENIKLALQFLAESKFENIRIGRYELRNGTYFMVQGYKTKLIREDFWETHRQYVDVQYIVRVLESIRYTNINNLKVLQEYIEGKDYFVLSGKEDYFVVCPGTFIIFYPEDVHMPCLTVKKSWIVKKVVVKIPIKERREE